MKKLLTLLMFVPIFLRATPIIISDGQGHTFTVWPITELSNSPSPLATSYFVLEVPGNLKSNISLPQLEILMGTNSITVSNLLSSSTFQNGVSSSSQNLFLASQGTSVILDYSIAKNFQVFSTLTNTYQVAFVVTNLSVATNIYVPSTVIIHNLASSNLSFSFTNNISWLSQASSTNTAQPTNVISGSVMRIGFDFAQAVGTNAAIIGHVNP